MGKADEERLLRDRKLVLLVDLDQTLIHTTNDDIPPNIEVQAQVDCCPNSITISDFSRMYFILSFMDPTLSGIILACVPSRGSSFKMFMHYMSCTFALSVHALMLIPLLVYWTPRAVIFLIAFYLGMNALALIPKLLI